MSIMKSNCFFVLQEYTKHIHSTLHYKFKQKISFIHFQSVTDVVFHYDQQYNHIENNYCIAFVMNQSVLLSD